MANPTKMRIEENVRLEGARIVALYAELGQVGAERIISRALEDISVHLDAVQAAISLGEPAMLDLALGEIAYLTNEVGMTHLCRVTNDLRTCLRRDDQTAQQAVLARLLRLGARSLAAMQDLQNTRG